MKDFDVIIKFIDKKLNDNNKVTYKTVLKTAEDLDIWNAVVAHYTRREYFNTNVFSSFVKDKFETYEIATLKIEVLEQ